MTPAFLDISSGGLALAALLILVNAAISLALRLGMERSLLIASVRTIVQLLLVGLVLRWVFALKAWPLVVALGLVMVALSAQASVSRTRRRFSGIVRYSLYATLVSSFLITGIALGGILGVHPWWEPQYVIPLLGMILGNTLNGISLGLDRFMEGLVSGRDRVESVLALGGTRWEAAREPIREALRTGMTPTINSMMVVGIVSLPGMMTGQLLAGASPEVAVRYQIMIMFMIAAATALGTLIVVLLGYRALFNERHQMLSHRLQMPEPGAGVAWALGLFRRK